MNAIQSPSAYPALRFAPPFLLLLLLPTHTAWAFNESSARAIYPNMVKIRSEYSGIAGDEHGFGLIMLEQNEFLYIAAPRHVVEDEDAAGEQTATSIYVSLYNAIQSNTAELVSLHDRYDLALLRVPKPLGFIWNHDHLSVPVQNDERVWLLGYDWQWAIQPTRTPPRVTHITRVEVEVASSVDVGMSGGVAANDKGIVGMIISDDRDKDRINVFRLDFLAEVVLGQWLRTELTPRIPEDRTMNISLDAGGYISLLPTSFDEPNPSVGYGSSLRMDFVWPSDWGIRLAHYDGRIRAKSEFALTNQSAEFRNHVQLNMAYLLYRVDSDLEQTPYARDQLGTSLFYVGFGVGEHNPRLNINKAGLRRLDSYSEFEGSYTDHFYSFEFGASHETFLTDTLTAGIDFGLAFTDTRYMGINVDDPFSENDFYDFMINFRGFLRWTFGRPPRPEVKALY